MTATPASYWPVDPEKVREMRRRRLLTIEGLAETTGLCIETIKRIESKGRPPNRYGCQASTVRLLAAGLECEPETLLTERRAG